MHSHNWVVSNPDQKNIKIGKAGRNRWRGKRPQTRGVAMNPVDHPHGEVKVKLQVVEAPYHLGDNLPKDLKQEDRKEAIN